MSILNDLRSVFNPKSSYVTGKVVNVKGDVILVSTINGQIRCSSSIISTLGEGDKVHVENRVIVGKLRPDDALKRYYI